MLVDGGKRCRYVNILLSLTVNILGNNLISAISCIKINKYQIVLTIVNTSHNKLMGKHLFSQLSVFDCELS